MISHRSMRWAWEQFLGAEEKLTLLALVRSTFEDEGIVLPGNSEWIVERLGVGEERLGQILDDLEEEGLISVRGDPNRPDAPRPFPDSPISRGYIYLNLPWKRDTTEEE